MAVYNHNDNTYIIPYSSNSTNDKYKYAIIDVYEDEILETRSQPWDGTLNLQQIYDRPVAPLVYLKDTLFVPVGESYEWFLNDELLGETEMNYWIPTESGTYKAHVDFREYSTYSTEYFISMTSVDETEVNQLLGVYPNPSSNLVNLEFAYSKSGIIKITDLSGQMVFKQSIKGCNSFQVNLNGLPQGFYIINVNTDKYQISNILSKL